MPVGAAAPDAPVDVRIRDGRVTEVAPGLRPGAGEEVLDGAGRWAVPGLWDQHVHPVMAAAALRRIDLAGTRGPGEATERVRSALADLPGDGLVLGYGHRSASWDRRPRVAELDAVTGGRPVALVSGDGHNGWLNSAALALLGRAGDTDPLEEDEWYAAYARLEPLAEEDPLADLGTLLRRAAARGVVGIADFEFSAGWDQWQDRYATGLDQVRVRAATYESGLDAVAAAGLRTGDPLFPGQDRATMGPLKVISDGSLNTLTARCCETYVGGADLEFPRGRANTEVEVLVPLLRRAREIGLTAAVHAIGDEAFSTALDAFEATGQSGTIEHAQLVAFADLPRMARLGLTASVQPAHLLDDRDVTEKWWSDRTERVYAFRSMLDAGVTLALGSDAPVAPLDPWLAMAAAVHRSADEREPWHPEQALTAAEALAASTDGAGTIAIGSRADVVLLDSDPLATQEDSAATATHLRHQNVALTVCAGVVTHSGV